MGSATVDYEKCTSLGLGGITQGKQWVYRPQSFIRKITVAYGSAVCSLKFQSHCSDGEGGGSFFGGLGGCQTDAIFIYSPNEYLVSISGTYGRFDGSDVVRSICFKTNKNCYGPYGSSCGAAFSFGGNGGVIVGFHGLVTNYYLTAIGVYVMPELLAFGPNSTYQCKIIHEPSSSMCKMTLPREVGPWGAGGGKPWNDGVFSTVKQVRVHVGELNVIYAFQFDYLRKDGKSVSSQIHGGTDGVKKIEVVNLDGEEEFLMGVSGFFGPVEGYEGLEAIASISFHTNKTIYGPIGEERVAGFTYYSSCASYGKVVGFHGRNNGFLSAIGVHMEYF